MESTEFQEQQQDFDTSIASPSPIVKAASEPVIIRVSPSVFGSIYMDSSDDDVHFTFKVSGMRLADVPSDTTTCVPRSNEYLADEALSDTSTLVEIDEKSFFEHENSRIQQDDLSHSSPNEYRSSTSVHPVFVHADVHPIPRVSLNKPENISLINYNQPVSVTVPSRTLEERNLIPIRENVLVRRAKKDIRDASSSAIVSITNPSNQDIPTDCPSSKNDSDTTSYKSIKPHTVRFHTLSNEHLSVESKNSEYIDNNFLLRNTVYSDNILIASSMDVTKISVPDTQKLTFVLTLIKRTKDTSTYISDHQSIKCQICQKDMTLIFYFFATGILCIYDKPKKAIHPYEGKKGTISMAHDECLGAAQLNDYKYNYFLQVIQKRAPILQWWRKKKETINILETINLMFFCLIISYGMGYVFYINYSPELTIMQKTFTAILICIYVLLIVWRFIYLVYVFRKYWKKLCKSNQIVQAIIWKCGMSTCILEEETYL